MGAPCPAGLAGLAALGSRGHAGPSPRGRCCDRGVGQQMSGCRRCPGAVAAPVAVPSVGLMLSPLRA